MNKLLFLLLLFIIIIIIIWFLCICRQLDAILISAQSSLNKVTWKLSFAFYPVCGNIITATLWQIHCISFLGNP